MINDRLPGIEYRFKDSDLLKLALTHRSRGRDNNERLEFVGDAVLNLAVTDLLIQVNQEADEGALSRLRAKIVRGDTLAAIAQELGLGEYLRLGEGEVRSGGHRRASILADTLEAVLGAIYLDGGYSSVAAVVSDLCLQRIRDLPDAEQLKDAKTRLQEWLQRRGQPLPEYRLVQQSGADHAKEFTIACLLQGHPEDAFVAVAGNRRKAEKLAADVALQALLGGGGGVKGSGAV